MPRLRASRTTSMAAAAAIKACSSPRYSWLAEKYLSMQHLVNEPGANDASCLKQYGPLSQPHCLRSIVCNQNASQSLIVHYVLNGGLDLQLGGFVERGCRFIEQQDQ